MVIYILFIWERDNEVLLQAGYDAIMIYPPGGAARTFSIADFERATLIL